MCDYSLEGYDTRPARNGEIVQLSRFGSGTMGFVAPDAQEVAVCIAPGTKLLVSMVPERIFSGLVGKEVTFAQRPYYNDGQHRDAIQIPGKELVLLQDLPVGFTVTVAPVPQTLILQNAVKPPAEELVEVEAT